MRLLSFGLALASGLLVVASSPRVAASEEGADLKARTYFAAGDYNHALDIYAQLYAETLHPTYLRNIARCHQNLGNADKAISSFREYLRKAKDLSPAGRAEIEGYIAEMEQLKRAQAASAIASLSATPPEFPVLVRAPVVTTTGEAVATTSADVESGAKARPFYARVWFWGVVASVAAAGIAVALLGADRSPIHGGAGVLDLRDNAQ